MNYGKGIPYTIGEEGVNALCLREEQKMPL
jgi:hypothetical protein